MDLKMVAEEEKNYGSSGHSYQASSSDTVDQGHLENNVPVETKQNETYLSKIQSKMLMCITCLSKLKLEMAAFIFTFSFEMTRITSTDMIIDKVCLVHFGYPSSICSNLQNFSNKSAVESLATNYNLGHSLLQVAPATVLACFIGPWSDDYGRKFPMILALVGMILDSIGSIFCAYFLETRVEYFFIPAIFTGILGGPVTILAVIYSSASDSTQLMERTMKYALLEMAAGFAMPFGATAGGWIYEFLGYTAVFIFATGGLVLALIWIIFLLKETRGLDNNDPWSIKLRNIFSCTAFIESFKATVKDRPNKGKIQVILLIWSICFLVIAQNSTGDINYLFVHHQFGWSNVVYSTITSVHSIIGIAILILVIPLLKRFRVGDPYIGLIGSISTLGKNVGVGLAWSKGIYHVARILGNLGGCANFAVRSRISKVVSNEDLGKVFSFVAAAESFLPVVFTILMSQLFRAFIDTFPGMPYIVLAVFLLLPLGVFSWMTCLPKMTYGDIPDTTQTAEDNTSAVT